ncbi:hypothetical protein Patl1_27826 [Pistacia atlantica]|uniref:Uncharacterized protein n=1 Tax=Pistacia atlantica TaxID=434234 RepID=A0ACC1BG34_9ROSI|nr:hypothetical protein Patl1_27826 [Pistacia atlantica]
MTEGFKEEIGRGSSGTVYKGTMTNCQKLVAVKKLKKGFDEEEREFLTEIKVIGRTHHKNLVRRLGYSSDGPKKVLVYEYMSNGDEKVDLKQLERMMKIALWCIIDEPSLRPSMKKVLLMLERTVDIPMPPNPISYLSTI